MRSVLGLSLPLVIIAACLLTGSHVHSAEWVTASSTHSPPYPAYYAVDGKGDTRWASRSFQAGDPQWLTIDLGRSMPITGVRIHWERAFAAAYSLRVSEDGNHWDTIYEQPDGRGNVEEIPSLSGHGRFLQLYCTKPGPFGLVSVWEIEFLDPAAQARLSARQEEARAAEEKETAAWKHDVIEHLVSQGISQIVFAVRQPGKDGHWYANFSYYADDENRLTYGDGGRLCVLDLRSGNVRTLLDDPRGGVRDPYVSYDGASIVFSYRPGGTAHYHLYEIRADGTGLRQLTDGPYDDIEPCLMPDDTIVFISSRCKRWVNCWLTQVAVMHRCDRDGGNIRPISANIEHDNTPWPLPDGRILYQRWEYVDRSQVDYHHLWTSRPDGTQQMVFYGNMHPSTLMIDAKPIPHSDAVVSIFSPGHGRREHDGFVTLVDPRYGPDDPRAARNITKTPDYRDPWAFSSDLFMAARDTRLVLFDTEGREVDLFRLSPSDVRLGLQCHEPRPLVPHPREKVLPDIVDSSKDVGYFYLADVYHGRAMQEVPRGTIKKLLVLESLPKPINYTGGMDPLTYGGSFTLERVLGTVPVAEDGSAYFEAPALRSIFFVALDANDMAVKRMRSFTTVQPGETVGCVGCHEPRSNAPLARFGATQALLTAPRQIEPIDDCPDVFDFPRDIQPILDRHCVDCHGYEKTERGGPYAGRILLSGDHGPMFSHAYFTMTVRQLFSDNRNRPRSNDRPYELGSPASAIFEYISGSHYGVSADAHERKMLRLWIDTGAPYPGTYAALGNGSIGGYFQNTLVETDFDWPTTKAGADVMRRRCDGCHTGNNILPHAISDERNVSFWRFDINDPRLALSRHIVFNLSRPDKSLLLLAPSARNVGGWELCRNADGTPHVEFASPDDPDYETLRRMVEAAARRLAEIKRFDMPGFRPPEPYLREMKRYGILPADFPADATVDPYQLDRLYWESLWYRPAG
ncbi:HzsA-related protein [Thermostilla marina]